MRIRKRDKKYDKYDKRHKTTVGSTPYDNAAAVKGGFAR